MATAADSEFVLALGQIPHSLRELPGAFRTENAGGRHDLRVGPEVLRLVGVNIAAGVEYIVGEVRIQVAASVVVRLY